MSAFRKIIFGVLVGSLLLSACGLPIRYTEVRGTGVMATISRPIRGINAVELEGVGNLVIQQGDQEALEIDADENLIKYIKTELKGTSLHIYIEDHVNLRPTMDIVYRLTVKDLRRVTAGGLGRIDILPMAVDRLGLRMSGANTIFIHNLRASYLSLDASGLSEITIKGEVESQDVRISGMGDYNANDFKSRKALVDVSGAGSALVWVTDALQANLSGTGSIQFYGSPIVNVNMSGAGSVDSLGDK